MVLVLVYSTNILFFVSVNNIITIIAYHGDNTMINMQLRVHIYPTLLMRFIV